MPITIKCPDCGHTEQSADGASKTCPQCEGTMAPPAKKKYQAKTTSLEDEDRAKKKSKARDEDDRPQKKAKAEPEGALSLDDDDDKGGPRRDGAAAEALELDPGFKDRELMRLVEEELSRKEVLHWAGRMCPELAGRGKTALSIFGFVFAGFGLLFCVLILAVAPGIAKVAVIIPVLFVAVGLGVALVLPKLTAKQAARTWYAVTNERAIVYQPSLWGNSGEAITYEPKELRRMRVKAARSPKGAGDLVFKTTIQTIRTSKGTSEQQVEHGFLGIENVREVETLIHKVLLGDDDDDDDDDDE